jgi:hypothetical protein
MTPDLKPVAIGHVTTPGQILDKVDYWVLVNKAGGIVDVLTEGERARYDATGLEELPSRELCPEGFAQVMLIWVVLRHYTEPLDSRNERNRHAS